MGGKAIFQKYQNRTVKKYVAILIDLCLKFIILF